MIWHGVLLSPSLGFPTVCWKTGGLNFFPRKAYCAYYKPRQRRKTRPRCALHHSWNCTNIIDRELSHTVCSHIPEYETFLLLHQSCRYQLSNTPPLHFFFTPCMQRFTNPHLVVRCMPHLIIEISIRGNWVLAGSKTLSAQRHRPAVYGKPLSSFGSSPATAKGSL